MVEATIVPGLLFYGALVVAGLGWAYLAAITWSFGALLRRVAFRKPIPPILIVGLIGLTARTVVAVASGSSFLYFFQPILANVVFGLVFLLSVAIGRPLIGRLAHEFWEITPDMAARPAVRRLFRRLSLLWAGVNLATATVTLALLVWLPLATFVAVKQMTGLAVTFTAVFVTISLSLRTARREGLIAVAVPVRVSPSGR